MHHHGTAAWMLLACAAFIGCASCSFGSSSLFFFAPFFKPHFNSTTNTTTTVLPCNEAHRQDGDYLVCAFALTNTSTGLMFLVGALVVAFGGSTMASSLSLLSSSAGGNKVNNRSVISTSTSRQELQTNHNDESNSENNIGDNDEDDENEGGGNNNNNNNNKQKEIEIDNEILPDEELPGERYFRQFYASSMMCCLFGGIASLLSMPSLKGGEVIIILAVVSELIGSSCCGVAVLSLLAGMSIRWPNLSEVLFEGAPRGFHSCKARKVDRRSAEERQQQLRAAGSGGGFLARAASTFEMDTQDALDYLHFAMTTPPALVFSAFIIGWCASCFFANVALQSVSDDNTDQRVRSSVFALVLLCIAPLLACLTARVGSCCSGEFLDQEFTESTSMATSRSGGNQQQQQQPLTARSQSSVRTAGGGLDGVGWREDDFMIDFFRSSIEIIAYSLAEVLGQSNTSSSSSSVDSDSMNSSDLLNQRQYSMTTDPKSKFYIDTTLLPRRSALRLFRSLRLTGTYLVFLLLPMLLCTIVANQINVIGFHLTSLPSVQSKIYDRLSALNMEPPFALLWWLVLYAMTKAVFVRGGLLKYLSVAFFLCTLAAASLFFLQGMSTSSPSSSSEHSSLMEFAVLLPALCLAAMKVQLLLFVLSLAFSTLPRPLFPTACCAMFGMWALGFFSAIRTHLGTESQGVFLIVVLCICALLVVITFLLILRSKAAFENPRALFMKMKQQAIDSNSGSDSRLFQGGSEGNNNNTKPYQDPRKGSTLSQQATSMFDVLPPHRLLHWHPADIDAAFTVFDSTESTYARGNNNNAYYNQQQQQQYGTAYGSIVAQQASRTTLMSAGGETTGTGTGVGGSESGGAYRPGDSNLEPGGAGGATAASGGNSGGGGAGGARRPKESGLGSSTKYYAIRHAPRN